MPFPYVRTFTQQLLTACIGLLTLGQVALAAVDKELADKPVAAPKEVVFVGVTDAAVLNNVKNNVELYQRLASAPKTPRKQKREMLGEDELPPLLAKAASQVKQAVKPFGYYQSSVAAPQRSDNGEIISININLGPAVIIEALSLQIDGAAKLEPRVIKWQENYPLAPGKILNQAQYDSAKKDLSRIGRQLGYLDAEFTSHLVEISPGKDSASITLAYDSGPRYQFGDITILWENIAEEEAIKKELISSYLSIESGEPFDEERLLELQSSLQASSLVTAAGVKAVIEQRNELQVPVEIKLSVAKRRAYGASAGFGTDTGPRATLNYTDRRINRSGHGFNSSLYVSAEKQNLLAGYRIPLIGTIDDSLNLTLSQTVENSDARDLTTSIAGFDVARSKGNYQWNYGVSYREEKFREGLVEERVNLLVPSVSWQVIDADDPRSPNKGWKLSTTLRGAHKDIVSDLSFLQLIVNAKAVYPLGRGRVLARSQFAASTVENSARLPESLRFFAGGDHSIRGYAYESIGATSTAGNLRGGENLLVSSIEYEHPLRGALALAAFVDAGDAFDDKFDLKRGFGVGLRYRLPFGAFRFDIASAQDLPDRPLRVHVTFGTDL